MSILDASSDKPRRRVRRWPVSCQGFTQEKAWAPKGQQSPRFVQKIVDMPLML
jgi:hypothetical protein